MTTRGQNQQRRPVDHIHVEPLSDPVRESDMQQSEQIFRFRVLLRLRFADHDDVLIAGGGYLQHSGTEVSEGLAPDCVVAFGVDPVAIEARNGYVIDEVGRPPDLVLEVGTRGKGRQDYR